MISFPPQPVDDQGQLRRIENGLRLVTVPFPHFVGLAHAVQVSLDDRVPTMGVFASGRLVANPQFVRQLKENELVFVLAHELFHLALRTHDRAIGSDPLRFNYAHDYIINDILRDELGFQQIPAGGLDWPGARRLSAEEILLEMEKDPSKAPPRTRVWQLRALAAGAGGPDGDVLDRQREREWFPGEKASEQRAREEALKEAAARALSLGRAIDLMNR